MAKGKIEKAGPAQVWYFTGEGRIVETYVSQSIYLNEEGDNDDDDLGTYNFLCSFLVGEKIGEFSKDCGCGTTVIFENHRFVLLEIKDINELHLEKKERKELLVRAKGSQRVRREIEEYVNDDFLQWRDQMVWENPWVETYEEGEPFFCSACLRRESENFRFVEKFNILQKPDFLLVLQSGNVTYRSLTRARKEFEKDLTVGLSIMKCRGRC